MTGAHSHKSAKLDADKEALYHFVGVHTLSREECEKADLLPKNVKQEKAAETLEQHQVQFFRLKTTAGKAILTHLFETELFYILLSPRGKFLHEYIEAKVFPTSEAKEFAMSDTTELATIQLALHEFYYGKVLSIANVEDVRVSGIATLDQEPMILLQKTGRIREFFCLDRRVYGREDDEPREFYPSFIKTGGLISIRLLVGDEKWITYCESFQKCITKTKEIEEGQAPFSYK